LVEALKKSESIKVCQSAINGFQKIQKADYLLSFGGEEALNPILESSRSWVEHSAIWFTEDPYENEKNIISAKKYNLALTTDHFSENQYGNKGGFLPLGVPGKFFTPHERYEKTFDLIMFGSLWPNRIEMLERITSHPKTRSFKILLISSQSSAHWVNQDVLKKINSKIIYSGGEVVKINRPLSLEQMLNYTKRARICLSWPRVFKQDTYSVPGPRIVEVGTSFTPQLLDHETQPAIRHLLPEDSYIPYSMINLEDSIADALDMKHSDLEYIGNQMFYACKSQYTWDTVAATLVERLYSI